MEQRKKYLWNAINLKRAIIDFLSCEYIECLVHTCMPSFIINILQ